MWFYDLLRESGICLDSLFNSPHPSVSEWLKKRNFTRFLADTHAALFLADIKIIRQKKPPNRVQDRQEASLMELKGFKRWLWIWAVTLLGQNTWKEDETEMKGRVFFFFSFQSHSQPPTTDIHTRQSAITYLPGNLRDWCGMRTYPSKCPLQSFSVTH